MFRLGFRRHWWQGCQVVHADWRMREEGESSQPDVMPFLRGRSEFQCSLWRQDQDRSVEMWSRYRTLWQWVVVLYIKNRLDCYCSKLATTRRFLGGDLHLRPLLPNKDVPSVGCLLDHITDLSYGASHTHRLCLTPELALFDISSTLLFGSQSLSGLPNDFLLRTYLNIHSPTIDCAIASTTEVC